MKQVESVEHNSPTDLNLFMQKTLQRRPDTRELKRGNWLESSFSIVLAFLHSFFFSFAFVFVFKFSQGYFLNKCESSFGTSL